MADPPASPSLADRLRALTAARVGLGRIGTALPTTAMLDFQLAHARARDAVHTELPEDFAESLGGIGVRSRARDRVIYLQRPDLGRRLDPADAKSLADHCGCDIAIVVADGLSATAVIAHAGQVTAAIHAGLAGWTIAPTIVARQARVAIGDDIAVALGAAAVIVLIGERPGLSAHDSLGAYVTWAPQTGHRDSERNCISNIRPPAGLGYEDAAARIATILTAARMAGTTGVTLSLPRQPGVLG